MKIGTRVKFAVEVLSAFLLILLSTVAPAKVRSGFHPNVAIQLLYDDNVRAVIDDFKEADSIFEINPDLAWIWLYGKHQFDLGYSGSYGFYFDETVLNYDDHHLAAHTLLDHTYRLNSEFNLSYRRDHDRPGQTNALPDLASEFDKWWSWDTLGKLSYGRVDSKGQIVVELEHETKRYTNNDQEFRDYDKPETTGTFYFRIAPKTRLLFEASLADYDYQSKSNSGPSQSNTEYRYLTGITWDITAITTGIFKIGYGEKRYDSSALNDTSGLTFWLDGMWNPNTFTRVTFGASRGPQESAQQFSGGFIRTVLQTNARHAITPRFALVGGLRYGEDEFEDVSAREDTRWSAGIGVKHSLLRWLEIGAEYRYEERNSSVDLFDFNSNLFMVTAGTKFD